jgi:mannose-6-phosphate isomerase-like protein (cupin superfamily)
LGSLAFFDEQTYRPYTPSDMQIVHASSLADSLPLPATSKWKDGVPFVVVFERGSMTAEYCALRGTDYQTPHEQDELYFVLSGTATFEHDDGDYSVGHCTAILLPAGERHRFKNMSPEFACWVVFWGPKNSDRGSS